MRTMVACLILLTTDLRDKVLVNMCKNVTPPSPATPHQTFRSPQPPFSHPLAHHFLSVALTHLGDVAGRHLNSPRIARSKNNTETKSMPSDLALHLLYSEDIQLFNDERGKEGSFVTKANEHVSMVQETYSTQRVNVACQRTTTRFKVTELSKTINPSINQFFNRCPYCTHSTPLRVLQAET